MEEAIGERQNQSRQGVSVRDRRERERHIWRQAFMVSLLLHLLVLLAGGRAPLPDSPFAAAGPQERDDRAAEGVMRALSLREVGAPDPVRPPPPVVVEVELSEAREVEPEATPEISLEVPDIPMPGVQERTGQDPEAAQRTDAGILGATGRGDAGTVDEGRFRVVPPSPRGMIIPPTNNAMRGREVQVWVFIDEGGRVVADSTRLEPPTSDRGFNRRLMEEAAQWIFSPATRDGRPVSAWFPYTISM